MAKSILGYLPRWEDLYGVPNPSTLTAEQRKVAFSTLVAGNGNDPTLKQAGVPGQPTGPLNTESALFMTHPINGLDDLLYIVLFGARPYARRTGGVFQPATREAIFRQYGVEHLACRHADPAAAMAAHGAVFNGRPVAFANPLGMYICSFASRLFLYNGNPIPNAWVRWSRGADGMYQRLEFGPGDNEDIFLDDIKVATGAIEQPVTGGFQVLQQVEVGPLVVVGDPTTLAEDDYTVLTAGNDPIQCHEADICTTVKSLKAEYDNTHATGRVAPRRMGIIGG
jgi:hypothetical protein